MLSLACPYHFGGLCWSRSRLLCSLIDGCGLVAVARCATLACVSGLGRKAASRGVHAFDSYSRSLLAFTLFLYVVCKALGGVIGRTFALLDFWHGCDVVLGVFELVLEDMVSRVLMV